MISIKTFAFSPFSENTYVIHDETRECAIVDPGCLSKAEEHALSAYIKENLLKPKYLLNTHAHIDHIFGNRFVYDTYGLQPLLHEAELQNLESMSASADIFGIPNFHPSPVPDKFLDEKDQLKLGNNPLSILHVPGHSPGHLAFVCHKQEFVIQGDVLFLGSIGRTDLPGGDFDTLMHSIRHKLFSLGDDYTVYCGHGDPTTIGYEKKHNPFLINSGF